MTPIQDKLLRRLRDLADLENGRRDLAQILMRGAALLRDMYSAPEAYIAVTKDREGLVCHAREGQAVLRTDPWDGPGNLGQHVLQTENPLVWSPGNSEDSWEPSRNDLLSSGQSWIGIAVPLPAGNQGIAVVKGIEATDEDLLQLRELSEYLGMALQNLMIYQRTEALALTDELTGLYNFRFLKAALKREMERAARYGQVFSIIMSDVDHLKRYNDVHGHLGGSELLRQLAAIISKSSRAIDLVAKYGGDEFMVILPQTRLEGSIAMADRIRRAVAETAFPHCKPGEMTISVGVASFPQHGENVEMLVGAADAALFRAKRQSRNCVVAADNAGSPFSDAA